MTIAQDICTSSLSSILNDDATSTASASDLNLALSTLQYLMDYWQLDPQTSLGLQEFVYTPAAGTQSITIGLAISAVLTSSGTTATVTTTQNHGRIVGDIIVISGATQTEYNGSYTVVTVPTTTTLTYTFAGSATTPATGTPLISANITTQAPPRLEEASFCRLNGVDFLIGFAASFEEYNINPVKSNQGYPIKCFYNNHTTSGIGRFYLWPASNGAELHIWIRQVPLAGFSSMTLSTTLTLPMGLQKPLIDSLAAELLDYYNVPQPAYQQIKQKAALSYRKWKRANLKIGLLSMPIAISSRTANRYTA